MYGVLLLPYAQISFKHETCNKTCKLVNKKYCNNKCLILVFMKIVNTRQITFYEVFICKLLFISCKLFKINREYSRFIN